MKTVKELLEEAKKIGSIDAPPIYQQHLKSVAPPKSGKKEGPTKREPAAEAQRSERTRKGRDKRKSAAKTPTGMCVSVCLCVFVNVLMLVCSVCL
jgi:hypothetical protein